MSQKALYDLSLKISANSAELTKNLKLASNQMKSFAKETGGGFKGITTAFGEVGGAIGGIVGEITDSLTTLFTAGGPIALVVAAVALIGKAWKTAKENVQLYLDAVDKVGLGTEGYVQEAKAGSKVARKEARGAVRFDEKTIVDAYARAETIHNAILKETDENKKKILQTTLDQIIAEYNLAAANIDTDKANRGKVTGVVNQIVLQERLKKLYLDQDKAVEAIRDAEAGFIDQENELVKLKTIILSKGEDAATKSEKEKAIADFTKIAYEYKNKKILLLTDEYNATVNILTLTGKLDELEDYRAQNANQIAEIEKAYSIELFKELRLEGRVTKETEAQLKAAEKLAEQKAKELEALTKIKDKNTEIARQMQFSTPIPSLKPELPGIQGTSNTGANALPDISIWAAASEDAFRGLADCIANIFTTPEASFKKFMESLGRMILQIIARLIAMIAVAVIAVVVLSALGLGAVGGMKSIKEAGTFAAAFKSTLGAISGFAEGGISYGNNLAIVGEKGPELVRLPHGSQVYSNSQSRGMFNKGQLVAKVTGRDLLFVMEEAQRTSKNSF
jgi:hypothetical protein